MPTYRYQCGTGHDLERFCTIAEMEEFESKPQFCDQCGRTQQRILAARRHISFHEGFYEHISENGAYISSMGELKRICRENGNYSVYAEDLGSAFRAREGRWV